MAGPHLLFASCLIRRYQAYPETLQVEMEIAVLLDVFREGHDVYIDHAFEDVMFRWEHQTRRVFRKFYGQQEVEIDHTSNLFREAISAGQQITAEQYAEGKSPDQ
jgi:hypothetical protein